MKSPKLLLAALLLTLPLASGCGDDGDPDFFPQILLRAEAVGGGGCFALDDLTSQGAVHQLDPGRVFELAEGGRSTFLLANAQPPYRATLRWAPDGCPDASGEIEVTAFEIQGPSVEPQFLSGVQPVAVVNLRQDAEGSLATAPEGTQVRFEICAPPTVDDDCTAGSAGREFTGTVGDAFSSHILTSLEDDDASSTPAIIFLENSRDRVSGLFRGQRGLPLRGELYVNGRLEDESASNGDVVLEEDL